MEGGTGSNGARVQPRGTRVIDSGGTTARRPSSIVTLLLSLAVALPALADNIGGAWLSPPTDNWPLIAIHAALTPDGRVLTYGTNGAGTQTGFFIYDIWDPAQGLSGGHITLDNMTLTDIFCSSQVVLPQSGSVLIVGGDNWTGTNTTNIGNNNSNVFRYTDNALSRGNNMNRARWYSSSTVLMNGEIYIQGGSGGRSRPEVRDLNGSFRLLSAADTSTLREQFPRNFIAPDGRVFGFDSTGKMYYVDPSGTGQVAMAGQFPGSSVGESSSAAMFRPGKILQLGGRSNGAAVIDITGPQPVVTPTQSMSSKRMWASATVLADGRVVATGGSGVANTLDDVNTSAEIWDPSTGQWTVGASGLRARLYHSSALLLPDASLLVAGGGAPGPLVNLHAEVYYPPYLYDATGNFAPRPSIVSAPDSLQVGQNFSIGVGTANIRRVTMVKTGSVTHSVNMDQRFIELPFTASSGTLFVQMPGSVAETPPGYYLVFVINDQGVPSVGKIVRMNISANPVVQLDYTPTAGGTGGLPFVLSCNSNETLAGIYGRSAGTYVDRVGLQCVPVDETGRWIGDPIDRGYTGQATGTAFTRTCPRDFAVSAFSGRASQYVDQLNVECKALTTSGKITGAGQFLGAVGGTGGTGFGPFNCSTGNPAYALSGRSSTLIDALNMTCRQAPITQVGANSAPIVSNPGNQVGDVGTEATLSIAASDPNGDTLSYSATGLPAGLGIVATTGVISGVPTAAGTGGVAVTVSDGTHSSTANFTWTISDANALILNPLPNQPPRLLNTPLTYTASSSNGINPEYRWQFGDGTETAWSTSPSVTHSFARPAMFWVTVTARDDRGIEQTARFSQMIHLPLTARQPAVSTNIMAVGDRLWAVNQDNDSVSVFALGNNQRLAEIRVGAAPRGLAIAPNGEVWVTNRQSASISVINPTTLSVSRTINLPYASQPFGLVFNPDGSAAYVALEGAGRVLKLDPSTGSQLAVADVGSNPRHLSVSADGSRLYVSRFITPRLPGEETATVVTEVGGLKLGGEVLVINASTLATLSTVVLRHSEDMDFENAGSGIPNYLGAAVISPDGASAWVPSKKDNIKRGTLRSGGNLNFQNTVRAISSRIDLATNSESFGSRIDHDNSGLASAALFDRYGVFLFVALETSREVAVIDAHDHTELFRINVGRAPQGLALSAERDSLYVLNFMDRTVGVYDLTELLERGQWEAPLLATMQSVVSENLSATVLKGKQFFYDARDTRLAREGYMSCASCHNDGGQDGRTWDMTGLGEGLRNTIPLRGRAGAHGFQHWSGNFDEIQDFEGQIRSLAAGTGLMPTTTFNQGTRSQPLGDPKAGLSADLDALAAYVVSLGTFANSPLRNPDGTLTADGVAGKAMFQERNCAECHGGQNFTVSAAANLRDVGTIKQPTSGKRLGATLLGIDTPTLRDAWSSAPYLHDGSAATLQEAVRAHSGVAIGDTDLAKLVAYLQQIDGQEPPPPGPASTFQSQDIGAVAAAGSLSQSGGVYTVRGSGATIGGKIDEFHYAWQPLAGNGEIVARVASLTAVQTWARAGLMLRETLTATSRHAIMYLTVGAGTVFQRRTSTGGSTGPNTAGAPSPVAPYWLRLTRQGNVITGYASADGITWTQRGTVTLSGLPATVYIGLAVTSNSDGNFATAVFDNLRLLGSTPDSAPPTVPSGLTATAVSASQINLAWSPSTDTGSGIAGYRIYRNGGTTPIATTTATSYSNTGLTPSTAYSYTVDAFDAASNASMKSSSAAATTLAPIVDVTAPTVPAGLTATAAGPNQVNLSWTASTDTGTGVAGYRVYRNGGATPIGTTASISYADTGLTTNTLYTYTVSAYDAAAPTANESGQSASANATTLAAATFQSQDIGAVAAAGSLSESGGVYTVRGSGANIGGTADEFHYAWQPLAGNGEIVARVTSLTGTDLWARAGLMLRENLTATSRHAIMYLTVGAGTVFQRRTSTGGSTGPNTAGTPSPVAPYWLRLTRQGNVVTGYTSADGVTWTQSGTVTLSALPASVYVGMAVTSHSDGTLATALFDNVKKTP